MGLNDCDQSRFVHPQGPEDELAKAMVTEYGDLFASEQINRPVEDELGLKLRTDHALNLPLEEASGFVSELSESIGIEDPPPMPKHGLPVIAPRPALPRIKAEIAADGFDVTWPEGFRRVELLGRPEIAAGQEIADAIDRRAKQVHPPEDAQRKGEVDFAFDTGELPWGF